MQIVDGCGPSVSWARRRQRPTAQAHVHRGNSVLGIQRVEDELKSRDLIGPATQCTRIFSPATGGPGPLGKHLNSDDVHSTSDPVEAGAITGSDARDVRSMDATISVSAILSSPNAELRRLTIRTTPVEGEARFVDDTSSEERVVGVNAGVQNDDSLVTSVKTCRRCIVCLDDPRFGPSVAHRQHLLQLRAPRRRLRERRGHSATPPARSGALS